MAKVTYSVLNTEIDILATADEARQNWQRKKARSLSLEQWVVRLIPVGIVIMFVVFYLLSAPHTVGILNRITPGWGWVSPIGLEIGVIVVAALREAGWRNTLTAFILISLLAVSILINVAGGVIAVIQGGILPGAEGLLQDGERISQFNMPDLLERYGSLPAIVQIAFVLAIILGVLIPIMGNFTGESVVKLAMGTIKLERTSIEELWAQERLVAVRTALYAKALDVGAGQITAGKWATKTANQLFPDDMFQPDGDENDAVSYQPAPTSGTYAGAHAKHQDFGFAGYARDRQDRGTGQDRGQDALLLSFPRASGEPQRADIDNKDSPGQGDSPGQVKMTRAMVKRWLVANPDRWREMSNHDISTEIIGTDSGYKTVQRTLRDLGKRR